MQIKNILTLAMAGFATAAPMNLDQISKSMNAIISSLDVLDKAVAGLSATSADFPGLLAKSDNVLKAINTGATEVSGTTAISLLEALPVNSLSTKLIAGGTKVVNAFIEKKDIIVKAGKGAEVLSGMQAQKAASTVFGVALKSKLPKEVRSSVDTATDTIIASLDVSSSRERQISRLVANLFGGCRRVSRLSASRPGLRCRKS